MKKIGHTTIRPTKQLTLLSQREMAGLVASKQEVLKIFRDCALAILNTDSQLDDATEIMAEFADFDIQVIPQSRGLKLEIYNAPPQAFVDGVMIRGIRDHLFSALRDIVYTEFMLEQTRAFDFQSSEGITNGVFRILRNGEVVRYNTQPKLVVCWGGHSISRIEYEHSKEVGYQLGLRELDIVTGCGIGAMKGPMKGAALGHAKQQMTDGRYIGITEPGIIASESPNAIVNELVILPDIEKRLEAFVRLAHCIIVFPGGVGTIEEILYLLAIVMHPDNSEQVPLIFSGPPSSRTYFDELEAFIVATLGDSAKRYYEIIIGNPAQVARAAKKYTNDIRRFRRKEQEAYYFNWRLRIDETLQQPFVPTHDNMSSLNLTAQQATHQLATNMRAAFSGIVAGNVKAFGINQVASHGPYQLHGDAKVVNAMQRLLDELASQNRMKLGVSYTPCYVFNVTE